MESPVSSTSATLLTPDGLRLALEDHVPPDARAHVLIVHGFGEHKGRYAHVVASLLAGRYACHLFDLRGHGLSEGARGDVGAFDEFIEDLELVVRHVRGLAPAGAGARLIVLGHSMGGLVALAGVIRRPASFAAVVASSPFVAPAFALSRLDRGLARLLGLLAPWVCLAARLDPRSLSHDPAVVDAYTRDPLVLRRIAPRLWNEIAGAQARLRERAREITVPALFLTAGDDRVVDAGAAREVFERLGSADRSLFAYDGFFHEVLNEAGRDRVLADLRRWLDERAPA